MQSEMMGKQEEAKDIANKLLNLDKRDISTCHLEWLEREIMKILEEKCRLDKENAHHKKSVSKSG